MNANTLKSKLIASGVPTVAFAIVMAFCLVAIVFASRGLGLGNPDLPRQIESGALNFVIEFIVGEFLGIVVGVAGPALAAIWRGVAGRKIKRSWMDTLELQADEDETHLGTKSISFVNDRTDAAISLATFVASSFG